MRGTARGRHRGKGDRPAVYGGDKSAIRNRVRAVLLHTRRYAFKGQARLARDVGVSRSTISRLLRGKVRPGFALLFAVAEALEKDLGRPVDPRELVSFDGRYPTASACALCGCAGCLPDEAYDEAGALRPEWRGVRPGQWDSLDPPPPPASTRAQENRHRRGRERT